MSLSQDEIPVKPGFDRVKKQFLMVFIGNILAFSQGTNIGWYSTALPVINSNPSPLLDGPISQEIAGWLGALFAFGCLLGCLGFGLWANWIGYKRVLQLATLPGIISWLLIIFGNYAWHIGVSRLLVGIATGGVYTCFPQFVAQIASDSVRGQLNSYIQTALFSGVLVGFIGGSYLPFNINPTVMIFIPVLFFVGFFKMPESPQFLLKKSRFEDAEKSLRFYRNIKVSDDEVKNQQIFDELKKFQVIAKQNVNNPPLAVSDFVNPLALRALLTCPFLMAVNQFSGAFAISSYAETIFKRTGSTVDPQMSSIVMAAMQVVGTYTASQLMDRVGRKVLLLVSLSGCFVSIVIAGTYSYLAIHGYDVFVFNWVPVVSLSCYIAFNSIGILPVPYVLMSEVFPLKIRHIGSTFCTSVTVTCQLITLRLLPTLMDAIELYGCMWLFAGVVLMGLIFTIFIVKETMGKNIFTVEVRATDNVT